jgi:hypothetical protein
LPVELTGEAEFIRTWYSVGRNCVNNFIISVASTNNTWQEKLFPISVVKIIKKKTF